MFKDSSSRLVPNQFNYYYQEDYHRQPQEQFKHKKNTILVKQPLRDLSNNILQSYQNQKEQIPTIISLNTLKNDNIQQFEIKKQEEITSQENRNLQNITQKEKNQFNQSIIKDTNIVAQQKDQQTENDFYQIKQYHKQRLQKQSSLNLPNPTNVKKPLFNVQLSDTSTDKQEEDIIMQSSRTNQIKQQNKQIKIQNQIQTRNIFVPQQQKNQKINRYNPLKFDVQLSSDSETEKTIVNQKKPQRTFSKLILNNFDSDESDKQCQDSKAQPIAAKSNQDQLQIIRNLNIKKLKVHFQFVKTDPNFLSFCSIPNQSKTSLIVKRDCLNSQYIIFDSELICPVLKVTKNIGGNYKFFMIKDKDNKQDKPSLIEIGKMKANFLGTQFHCYSYKQNDTSKQKYQCISIIYDVNILGLNGPRKVKFYATQNPIPSQQNLLKLSQKSPKNSAKQIKTYQSKAPQWKPQLNAYVLNLRGTASYSSIKNCIIVDSQNQNKQHIIFGKKSKDIFNLQIKYPFTVLQGVAFAVSSFEKKLGCQ